jgi:hypothetical protein
MFKLKVDDSITSEDNNYKTAEWVYVYNENSFAGRYPIGQNSFWHSGIHIRSQKVYPLLEGWLTAYRISEDYKRIPRLEELSLEQYKILDDSEKHLYGELNQGRIKKYRLKTPCPNPDELYSNSFFLIKHQIRLPAASSNRDYDTLEFFTLYTNIAPTPKPSDNFEPIDKNKYEKGVPFYENNKFKVIEPYYEYKYTEINNKKIFSGSHCSFHNKNADKFICKFINTGTEIEIARNEIEIISSQKKYTPKEFGIPVYDKAMPQNDAIDDNKLTTYKKATLNMTACFMEKIELKYTGFMEVTVDVSEVNPDENNNKPINSSTRVLVRTADLNESITGTGYLKNDASILNKKIKGIMIYDEPAANSNARDILVNNEFEFESLQGFWTNYNKSNSFFSVLKQAGGTERKKYLHFKKRPENVAGQDIRVKVSVCNGYKYGETVICNGSMPNSFELLDHNTLLGGAAEQVSAHKEHYDLVLFFDKEKDKFFNNHALTGYRIPAGVELYAKNVAENGDISFNKTGKKSTEEMTALKNEINNETETKTSIKYAGVYNRGKLRYVVLEQIEKYEGQILDWDENFIKLGNVNNPAELLKEVFQLVVEYFRRKNRTEKGIEKEWNFNKITEEPSVVKVLKRKLVCRHQLEWDKTLYDTNSVPLGLRLNWRDARFREQVEAVDIWGGLSNKQIDGLNLSENKFIFAHPVYFADYLDREGVLTGQRIRNLIMVQDKVMALNCLIPNIGKGIYHQEGGVTFCNHAVYLTIKTVDGNYKEFIGNTHSYCGNQLLYKYDTPPDSLSCLEENFKKELGAYPYRISNLWCDILKKQAEKGILIKLNKDNENYSVGEKKAQEYANMGYVVVGAWKNTIPGNNPPHFATVRPGYEYKPNNGPILANVGGSNEIKTVKDGFGGKNRNDINWYYNPKQDFQEDISMIFNALLTHYKIN